MAYSPLTEQLIQSLRSLPGIGVRSAQKMALHLLERDRIGASRLADALTTAVEGVGHCSFCQMLTEDEICLTCLDTSRDKHVICVVETPSDFSAIEESGAFAGQYFILMGHLSPINGIGPDDIGIPKLMKRLESESIKELIIATNPTVEGEATAHYIATEAHQFDAIQVTRIAHGIPAGGLIEQVDGQTLHRALHSRATLE